jgi:DNA-directed RNA polymerase specialized sigma subunit
MQPASMIRRRATRVVQATEQAVPLRGFQKTREEPAYRMKSGRESIKMNSSWQAIEGMIDLSNLFNAFNRMRRNQHLKKRRRADSVLSLLTQHIAQLPRIPKKVLAMYYHENLDPAEIATALGLTANEIEQIRTQTVRLLRNKLVDDLRQPDRPA